MSNARNLANLLNSAGDVKSDRLDNVPVYANASSSADGLLRKEDKSKLDAIEASANNYTHPANHAISVTTGLQTALDAKLPLAGGTLTGNLSLGDAVKATFGASDDLQIYHDGANSYIDDAGSGVVALRGSTVQIGKYTGELMAQFVSDGAVQLRYDNSQKLATTSTGIDVTGDIDLADNGKIKLGNSDDLQIYHDGSNSFIKDVGTGNLKIGAENLVLGNSDLTEDYLIGIYNGAVSINYNGSTKLATTSTGVSVTGDMTASGNVTAYSDERLKSSVETIPDALSKILSVRGVTFTMNDERGTGVIAQELEQVLPEAVFDNEDGMKSVAYGNITGLLIEAIKELSAKVEELENK